MKENSEEKRYAFESIHDQMSKANQDTSKAFSGAKKSAQ